MESYEKINRIISSNLKNENVTNQIPYTRIQQTDYAPNPDLSKYDLNKIAFDLEKEFSITIPKIEVRKWETITDIYSSVSKLLKANRDNVISNVVDSIFVNKLANKGITQSTNYNMLTHVCRIDGHPLKYLPESIKYKYLMGLGNVLYVISNGNETMKTLFKQWAYSITKEDMSFLFTRQPDVCVSKALSLNRVGFRFFRCKHEFFFDCFYLTESYDKSLLPKLQEYLSSVGQSFYTKKSLLNTIQYFDGKAEEIKASPCQVSHRSRDHSFNDKRQSRVLVVANVSTGKSTLINALIGYNFNKVRTNACTSRLCRIYNKPVQDGLSFYKSGILQYDAEINSYSSDDTAMSGVHFKSTLGELNICLIDTPGVNNSVDLEHWRITTDAINSGAYDILLFISNSKYNGTVDERKIMEYIRNHCRRPVLFALNQLDCFKSSEDSISKMIVDFANEIRAIGFKQPLIYPISALYASLIRREETLDEDERFNLELTRKRFLKDYYNLPQYVNGKSTLEIERTGIIELEKEIINLLK
jgi:GTPase Era involved in 16S rRNA processing/acyl carrier protein